MQSKILKTLCVALNAAKKRRLIDYNPATEYKLPRVRSARPPRPRVWWSSDKVRRFLEATRDDRLHALWRVALLRGLRRGELLGLCWADVDLDQGMLFVRGGKTESSKRTVSLDAGTVTVLRDHRKRQLEERLATFGAYQDNDLVFAQKDGRPIPNHRITFGFQKLARQHDLPVMRFHDARHTAASIALESGIDIKVVSDQLGHSTTRITHDLINTWSAGCTTRRPRRSRRWSTESRERAFVAKSFSKWSAIGHDVPHVALSSQVRGLTPDRVMVLAWRRSTGRSSACWPGTAG
jgi:integrase